MNHDYLLVMYLLAPIKEVKVEQGGRENLLRGEEKRVAKSLFSLIEQLSYIY